MSPYIPTNWNPRDMRPWSAKDDNTDYYRKKIDEAIRGANSDAARRDAQRRAEEKAEMIRKIAEWGRDDDKKPKKSKPKKSKPKKPPEPKKEKRVPDGTRDLDVDFE
jgi:hypothetical protein